MLYLRIDFSGPPPEELKGRITVLLDTNMLLYAAEGLYPAIKDILEGRATGPLYCVCDFIEDELRSVLRDLERRAREGAAAEAEAMPGTRAEGGAGAGVGAGGGAEIKVKAKAEAGSEGKAREKEEEARGERLFERLKKGALSCAYLHTRFGGLNAKERAEELLFIPRPLKRAMEEALGTGLKDAVEAALRLSARPQSQLQMQPQPQTQPQPLPQAPMQAQVREPHRLYAQCREGGALSGADLCLLATYLYLRRNGVDARIATADRLLEEVALKVMKAETRGSEGGS